MKKKTKTSRDKYPSISHFNKQASSWEHLEVTGLKCSCSTPKTLAYTHGGQNTHKQTQMPFLPGEYVGCSQGSGSWRVANPGVLQNISCWVAFARLTHQQVSDQILGRWRDAAPLQGREEVVTILDAVEKHLLAVLTSFPTVPAALLPTLAIEWWVATQHDVPVRTKMIMRIKTRRQPVVFLSIKHHPDWKGIGVKHKNKFLHLKDSKRQVHAQTVGEKKSWMWSNGTCSIQKSMFILLYITMYTQFHCKKYHGSVRTIKIQVLTE